MTNTITMQAKVQIREKQQRDEELKKVMKISIPYTCLYALCHPTVPNTATCTLLNLYLLGEPGDKTSYSFEK